MLTRFKVTLFNWALAFAVFAAVGAVVYAQVSAHTALGHWLSPVLAPGAALYIFLNGSLLFGGGFGSSGNFAVFVLGSAAVWASVLLVLVLVVRAVAASLGAGKK